MANVSRLAREIFRACPTVETIIAQGLQYISAEIGEGSHTVLLGFIDLPTEVLLLIFHWLDEELFSLSILCRRLHFLALPIFLERNAIPDPCGTVLVDFATMPNLGTLASPDAVQALSIALFVPSIEKLTCVFPAAHTYQRIAGIRRITRLVQRLATLKKLSLEFIPHYNNPHEPFRRKEYSQGRLWQGCYSALHDLLDIVNSKLCTSLAILGSPASNATEAPSCPAPSIRSVSHLSFDAGFSPGYLAWIFSALKDSPIVSLELNVTDDTQLNNGAVNFPATLTCLSLDGGHVLRPTVLAYLGRHPLLKNLTLGRALPSTQASDMDPLHLNNLVALTASFSYVSHFFLHVSDSPFPVLERLTILLDNGEDVGWALASFIERVREGYSESRPPVIAVEITGFMLNLDLFADSIAFTLSMGGKWTHAARHISELRVTFESTWFTFSDTGTWVDPAAAQLLLNWFRLFSCVHDISIDLWDGVSSAARVGALVDFASLIGEALSSVQTIRFKEQIVFERL
ncbi:hypothetical protein K438DRAFT_1808449 [Mycena galopus ATCC 62051]|nr:hypothetical protein K438DRAFT_1808449 [Mycena galopus ATCC 62051]